MDLTRIAKALESPHPLPPSSAGSQDVSRVRKQMDDEQRLRLLNAEERLAAESKRTFQELRREHRTPSSEGEQGIGPFPLPDWANQTAEEWQKRVEAWLNYLRPPVRR